MVYGWPLKSFDIANLPTQLYHFLVWGFLQIYHNKRAQQRKLQAYIFSNNRPEKMYTYNFRCWSCWALFTGMQRQSSDMIEVSFYYTLWFRFVLKIASLQQTWQNELSTKSIPRLFSRLFKPFRQCKAINVISIYKLIL